MSLNNSFFEKQYNIKSTLVYGKEPIENDYDIDIVIPTYKRRELLIQAIKSITSQKEGYDLKWHAIIVSNDPNYDIAEIEKYINKENFTVYINDCNLGMVGNINRCVCLSKSKYVAYLQDDDILLDTYLLNIDYLLKNNKLADIDCLIPNRLLYVDSTDNNSQYGKKVIMTERIKTIVSFVLLKKSPKLLERITYDQCAEILYNGFGGGPTCGMLFNRKALLGTKGFSHSFPYAFDMAFFIENSEDLRVYLYNKDLSVYRLTYGASRKPEVLLDFYRCDRYLVEKAEEKNLFVKKFKKEIIRYSYDKKPLETRMMVDDAPAVDWSKYMLFKFLKLIKMTRSSIYRRKILDKELIQKYGLNVVSV